MTAKNSPKLTSTGDTQEQQSRMRRAGVISGVLLLAAVMLLWRTLNGWQQEGALNRGELYTRPTIISRIGPGPADPMTPFESLGLTSDQRQQIKKILDASITTVPPGQPARGLSAPSKGGPNMVFMGAPHGGDQAEAPPSDGQGKRRIIIRIPMDKIRAILTPEQRQKLDQQKLSVRRAYPSAIYRSR
ncbi:MAG: Spy/CpxP family protein refolding chaperone [Chloroflexi bacterium]|nr:Spy/CpxP family protein refolding chaperone [Chloroflexota bacterium]